MQGFNATASASPHSGLTAQEWMSSPFQRYFKYPALLACAMIFMAPRWQKGKAVGSDAAAAAAEGEGEGGAMASAEDELRAASGSPSGAGAASNSSGSAGGTGTGGSKKRRGKALRAGKTG